MRLKPTYKSMAKMMISPSIVLCIVIAAIMVCSIIMTAVASYAYSRAFTPETVAELNSMSDDSCVFTYVDKDTIVISYDDGTEETIHSIEEYARQNSDDGVSSTESEDISVNGMESAVMIFLFVCGIVMFKQNLYLGFANGISRKTSYLSTILVGATYSVILMIIYYIIDALATSVLSMMFSMPIGFVSFPAFIQNTVSAFGCFAFGVFIGGLYYRMNKPLKIIVSVGVPITVFLILPTLVGYLSAMSPKFAATLNNIGTTIITFLSNPLAAFFAVVLEIAILIALGFLLIRKAVIKENLAQ